MKRFGIEGLFSIAPQVFFDERGYFLESYALARYASLCPPFVQDNRSFSKRGVLRGLHGQKGQGKLVSAPFGVIFDVAVDCREGSKTFGQWEGVILSGENHEQFYIPPGFLHGFCVLSDEAIVEYKVTAPYTPADEIGVRWDDPLFAIKWPMKEPILSPKDRQAPFFSRDLCALG